MTERTIQFAIAALMVALAALLMWRALDRNYGLIGTTVVSSLLVAGAVVLAQDRPQR